MLSQVYKAKRTLFSRLYPTTLVYKDGSTISMRYHEPRQIIKLPFTLEDATNHKAKTAWQLRRIAVRSAKVESVEDVVTFDARKYLRPKKK